jgi:lipopolysaccharide transport system ATP-binding protein
VLVRVEGLSKKYCRDLKRSLWYGLKDTAADLAGRGHAGSLRRDEFWALETVSLTLARGSCLGVIGRNGAGKTTLLKMLNGLVKPDRGRIELHGRVGALISLGAGFNPVLTGRENVYVNGAVLGLSTREIDDKLDEIVEFAELGDFIDAPVQGYSAGMHVRLGFAVATALQPDILLLDEVLAVGDAAFRGRCYDRLARMRDTAAFVLVSHDMDQIARVCSDVLLLDGGRDRYQGDVGRGIRLYQEMSRPPGKPPSAEHVAEGVVASIDHCDAAVPPGGRLAFTLRVQLPDAVPAADMRVVLWSEDGIAAADAYTRTQERSLRLEQGDNRLACAVGPLQLRRGRYSVSIALLNRANNLHLYWGDRVRAVDVDGPVTSAVAYTPSVECRCSSVTSEPWTELLPE